VNKRRLHDLPVATAAADVVDTVVMVTIDVKTFFNVFYYGHVFTFLMFFFIFQMFFILEKRWHSSERQAD